MIVASETYDYEPFDKTEHSMKQIADAIRHKGYGKDVREAIAQGFEYLDKRFDDIEEKMNEQQDTGVNGSIYDSFGK